MKIIYNDGTVAECPAEDELHVIRHSAAHILAQAIKHPVSPGALRLRPRHGEGLPLRRGPGRREALRRGLPRH